MRRGHDDREIARRGSTASVLQTGEAGYDEAGRVWNGAVDHHPAVIARCASTADVAAALAFAQRAGLEVGVRGGGHNYGGAAVPEGGLMVDLRPAERVTVDPVPGAPACGGGARAGRARRRHPGTRAGGHRRHDQPHRRRRAHPRRRDGLADPRLRARPWTTWSSAEVVLADGRLRARVRGRASGPALGAAGGGGNFGVVTEFEFRLHPVGPIVHLGLLFWEPGARRRGAARGPRRDRRLPGDAGGMIVAVNAPPAPFVPEQHHFAPGVRADRRRLRRPPEEHAASGAAREALPAAVRVRHRDPYTALQRMLDESAALGRPRLREGALPRRAHRRRRRRRSRSCSRRRPRR